MLLKNTSIVPAAHVMCPTFFPYSLPSGTCQCCFWGQTEWESGGRNQCWFPHWLCLFLFIPLGTLRFVCFVFFSSHFLPRNFTAACKGDNPALLAGNGSLRAPWKCWKLCFPECLFKKSEFTQLALSACYAKGFATRRYKIPSHSLFRSSSTVLSVQTLTRQKLALEILLKIYRKFSQQCNKASGSTSNP